MKILLILLSLALGTFACSKFMNETETPGHKPDNDSVGFVYDSYRSLFANWDTHNHPAQGEDSSYSYTLETKSHNLSETATELRYHFKAQVQKSGSPVSAYIKAGTIYAKDNEGNTRKIQDFYPTHNAPKDGFYLSPEYWNEVRGSVPLSLLEEGENIFWEPTSVVIN